MTFVKSVSACTLCVAILTLAGCSHGIKKTLGMERNTPDEFAVVERAPLTVPPNFDLMPPAPGAARPQESAPVNTARGLILRSETNAPATNDGLSGAENALLNKAGGQQADPNIRADLQKSADAAQDANQPVIEKLGLRKGANEDGKALNATEEAQRLQKSNIKSTQTVRPAAQGSTTAP